MIAVLYGYNLLTILEYVYKDMYTYCFRMRFSFVVWRGVTGAFVCYDNAVCPEHRVNDVYNIHISIACSL
jgi:hypothetical protein